MIVQIFLNSSRVVWVSEHNILRSISFNDNAATGTKVFHWPPRRRQTLGKFAEKFRLSATNFLQYLSAEIDSCGKHLSGTNMSPPLVWNFLRNCVKRKILRAKVLTWKICFSTKISLIKPPMSENLHQKLREHKFLFWQFSWNRGKISRSVGRGCFSCWKIPSTPRQQSIKFKELKLSRRNRNTTYRRVS